MTDLASDPTYKSWRQMMRRCHGKGDNTPYYRERGIRVCERWHAFENFLADMGNRPEEKTIDRIDVNGDYAPGNCRWASRVEQMRNKTTNCILELNGEAMCIAAWTERLGVDRNTIRRRIKKGWPIDQVLRGKSERHHINGRKRNHD